MSRRDIGTALLRVIPAVQDTERRSSSLLLPFALGRETLRQWSYPDASSGLLETLGGRGGSCVIIAFVAWKVRIGRNGP